MEGKTKRIASLEGLRGLAAVSVVLYHFLILFFPAMYYGSSSQQHVWYEDSLHGMPFMGLVSGDFAVATFFVLSGFVLTVGFFRSKEDRSIKSLAARRYLRLMLPALASVLLAWVLIVLGLSYNQQAFSVTQSSALNLTWETNTNIFKALYEGAVGVFIHDGPHPFNSVLWTMKYEFIGSFMVFMVAYIFGTSKNRAFVYAALLLALVNTWYLGFIVGMVLADLYVNKESMITYFKGVWVWILGILGIALGSFPWGGVDETYYRFIEIPWLDVFQNQAFFGTIGAVCLMVAIINSKTTSKILSSRIMQSLGAHTFSLYLVHQPIIYTVGLYVFVRAVHEGAGYQSSVAMSALIVLPIISIATIYFYKYIEVPAIHFASRFERFMNGPKLSKEMLMNIGIAGKKRVYRVAVLLTARGSN